ncbi:MAG: discoidin domain-containing protein [Sedimentisphaerales bacterium]|nr:discoidin domain-containing protein [Sedimentisphaerales bacterium]
MGKQWVYLVVGVVMLTLASSGSAAELAHRWSFNGDLKDSVGGKDAVIVEEGANDAILSDTEVTMTGGDKAESDYVDLPDHVLSDLGSTVTFEAWATHLGVQTWSRVFAFGTSTAEHMTMSWCTGTNINTDHVEFFDPDPSTNSRLDNTNSPYELGVPWHIVVVFEPGLMTWYSAPAGSDDLGPAKGSFEIVDVARLNDTNCWLGRSHYGDGTANASYDECRLWVGALSQAEREKLHDLGPDRVEATLALNPSPQDRATDVAHDAILTWEPGDYAAAHDVYLGTVLDDVAEASRSNPLGALVSQGQPGTAFASEDLEFGQTYYWRIDEVNAPPSNTIFTGEVWSFTVEPYLYPIENVAVTASTTSAAGEGPERVVDGSGLSPNGQHSNNQAHMWLGNATTGQTVWIQFDFGKTYKLMDMRLWNYNMAFEAWLGLSAKDVTIEYTSGGTDWTTLGDFVLPQGPAVATYEGTVLDLEGIAAQALRINIHSNYGTQKSYGLSEVRFSYLPVQAREPEPADGATEVALDTLLDWRGGRQAALHELYLGTEADALALVDAVAETWYNPGGLNLGTTYYWQVNEVNETATPSVWEGDRWSFSTQSYLAVDDFESYTDEGGALIYEAWVDGYNINDNGSQVGHDSAPYAERSTVHGGRQSMPFYYNNTGGVTKSEAVLTLDAAQDWTQMGAERLVAYFSGDYDNAAVQLYLSVKGTRVDYAGSVASLQTPAWKQWDIDLASLGAAARNVKTLTLGVSGIGTGVLYVDDVRLYRVASAQPEPPVDPGTNDLVAQYDFENNLNDATGNGYDGTSPWALVYTDAPGSYGQAISFAGEGDYVELPVGSLVDSLTDCTIATLVNFNDTGVAWGRVFDFGSGNTNGYMLLAPRSSGGPIWFAITPTGGSAELIVTGSETLPTGWHHVAVVVASASMTAGIYVDGVLVGEGPIDTLPTDLGVTTQNWLGRSQYEVDAYFNGALDDFRIYRRALSGPEIRYLAGER